MSKKRKAEGLNLASPQKRSPNATSSAPLSAFAAAKAKLRNDNATLEREVSIPDESRQISVHQKNNRRVKEPAQPSTVDSKSLAKRRPNDDNTTPPIATGSSPEMEQLLDSSLVYQSDESSDEKNTESEHHAPTPVRKIRLSSWMPTSTNIVSSNPTADRLLLTYGQTLSILGQYKLKVHDGLVTISGTFLTPASTEQEVTATSVYALPPIKCISSGGAEIEIQHLPPRRRSLQQLQQLSPLFDNILYGSSTTGPSFIKVPSNVLSRKVIN
jgi:hypothetical protein